MQARIKSEDDLLSAETRKKIIADINSHANIARKDRFYRFYQCYKDNTKKYVFDQLLDQFDSDTVKEMTYALTNLGFARKVVDKLARVYNNGVTREVYSGEKLDEQATAAIKKIVDECDINRMFKKTNRWLKRDKNTVQYIIPRRVSLSDPKLHTIKPVVLPPYLYDAVELEDNREIAACFILSDYIPNRSKMLYTKGDASVRMNTADEQGNYPLQNEHVDANFSDQQLDETADKLTYTFWSDKYHFTCNSKGEILNDSGEPIQTSDATVTQNPIGVMPFINYAEDQDNCFWAQGGDDLIDGSISINSIITNILHIAITQGYGQAYYSGATVPRALKLGPNKLVIMEHKSTDEPTPKFGFETANPPLAELRQLVEFYVALLLTTNNLSTSGISTTLGNAANFASGIAMMIDKAESMEDIDDQRQIFKDNEPIFWNIFAKWQTYVSKASDMELVPELKANMLPENVTVVPKYVEATPLVSETERLDVLKKKKDLGLVSRLGMLKVEYPDLTDEQLVKKLEEIILDEIKSELMKQTANKALGENPPEEDSSTDENQPPEEAVTVKENDEAEEES